MNKPMHSCHHYGAAERVACKMADFNERWLSGKVELWTFRIAGFIYVCIALFAIGYIAREIIGWLR